MSKYWTVTEADIVTCKMPPATHDFTTKVIDVALPPTGVLTGYSIYAVGRSFCVASAGLVDSDGYTVTFDEFEPGLGAKMLVELDDPLPNQNSSGPFTLRCTIVGPASLTGAVMVDAVGLPAA